MSRAEWALTGILLFVLVYAAALVVVFYRRRRRFDREAQAEYEALLARPAEPINDPCVTCGHSRGDHYERIDHTRGACTVGTRFGPAGEDCLCAKYVADRPQVLLGVVYDQSEED